MRALLTGWFSFHEGEATAGDLAAAEVVRGWLAGLGFDHDVAASPALAAGTGDLRLDEVDPERYTHLVFCCGPLAGKPVEELARRFAHCRRVAIGVSVVGPAATGFDEVLARDGDGPVLADLAFLDRERRRWPLAALVLSHDQPEYGDRSRHGTVHATLREFLDGAEVAVVDADTRIDPGAARQRSVSQLEAVLRAADVVVTTRLHGLVFGLRCGTPVVAVDPIAGGAKVRDQAQALGWPAVLVPEALSEASLSEALDLCLHPGARHAAEVAAAKADGLLRPVQARFEAVMAEHSHDAGSATSRGSQA